ncbi:MAG: hypothetical protein ACK44D_01865 [Bacteroidia bacterium]|jgi:hypothetical protein
MFKGVVLLLVLSSFTTANLSITEVRNVYEKAIYSQQIAVDLIDKLNASNNNTFLGYKGAVTMIMAKHVFSPYKKLNYFKNGKEILEQAILKEPLNIELRFLRFSIQSNSPKFLDYHSNLFSDKSFLLKEVKTINDTDLKQRITKFLLNNNEVSKAEKLTLQQ